MGAMSATKAPVVTGPTRIRNVVLVGPSGSGKSRLFDHVVGSLAPDHTPRDPDEVSTGLRAATVATGEVVLTLLDAPGSPDFVGEVRAGLRAAIIIAAKMGRFRPAMAHSKIHCTRHGSMRHSRPDMS